MSARACAYASHRAAVAFSWHGTLGKATRLGWHVTDNVLVGDMARELRRMEAAAAAPGDPRCFSVLLRIFAVLVP